MNTILIEALDLTEAVIQFDAHAIENVVLIRAGMSANRRFYSESVLETAAPVFNEIRAYANHPRGADKKEGRSVRDLTGWYSEVRYQEGGLRATRHFFDTQAGRDAWAIAEAVVSGRAPKGIAGLSINAAGTGKMEKFDDGEALRVESILYAYSVDDVDEPAAGGSYRERADGDGLATALVSAMTYEELSQARPDFVERLKNEWKAVRLEDATKTALAESDRKVKAAEAQLDMAKQAHIEAQTTITTLTTERDTALADASQARRERAIEIALRAAKLPLLYENDLRKRLLKTEVSEWSEILTTEKQKAQKQSAPARVPVTGSSQQVQPSHTPALPTERLDMSRVETPEDLQRQLERLRRG